MLVDLEWGARLKTLIANGAVENQACAQDTSRPLAGSFLSTAPADRHACMQRRGSMASLGRLAFDFLLPSTYRTVRTLGLPTYVTVP